MVANIGATVAWRLAMAVVSAALRGAVVTIRGVILACKVAVVASREAVVD